MMKEKSKGIVSRFKDKLVKMIKDVHDGFDDYLISPIIRYISLHWCYELVADDCHDLFFCLYKTFF